MCIVVVYHTSPKAYHVEHSLVPGRTRRYSYECSQIAVTVGVLAHVMQAVAGYCMCAGEARARDCCRKISLIKVYTSFTLSVLCIFVLEWL